MSPVSHQEVYTALATDDALCEFEDSHATKSLSIGMFVIIYRKDGYVAMELWHADEKEACATAYHTETAQCANRETAKVISLWKKISKHHSMKQRTST